MKNKSLYIVLINIVIFFCSSQFLYAQSPDFVIVSVAGPSTATPGATVNVTVQARNQGANPTQTGGTYVILRMILSPDTQINLSDVYYSDFNIPITSFNGGVTVGHTYSYTIPSNLSGTYYWGAYVDAGPYWNETNENNNAYLGSAINVVSCTIPSPPALSSPTSGTTVQPGNVTFSWNASTNANRYRLKVCTDASMTNPISVNPFEPTAGVRQYTLNLAAGTYYWQVAAISSTESCGWGNYGPSPVWSIDVNNTIGLISPSQNKIVTSSEITFVWSNMKAVRYELYVDNASGLGSPEISKKNIPVLTNYSDTVFTISGNWLSENVYYWKVIAFFTDGKTIESTVGTFTYNPEKLTNPIWEPLYRLYKAADHDHFYCISENHRQQAINAGFIDERVDGFISASPFNDALMVNIYRLNHPILNSHYYTIDGVDRDNKIIEGYNYEGIIGYAYKTTRSNLVPFYKLHKNYASPSGDIDNFYTSSYAERINARKIYGFSDDGIMAYCSATGDNRLQPFAEGQVMAGDGINTLNGNFQHYTKTSFSLQGKGIPLEFGHIYNSSSVWLPQEGIPLGPGWSHTYNSYAFFVNLDQLNRDIYVVWPDGNIHHYHSDGTGFVCMTPEVQDVFSFNETSMEITIKKKNQTVFTYKKPGNSPNGYPAHLDNIKDKNANTINLTYETEAQRLTQVTSSDGRSLTFKYNTAENKQHLISEVVENSGTRSVKFNYDENGNLVEFIDAKNQSYKYSYDELAKNLHLLKTITKPEGTIITNTYKTDTSAVSGMRLDRQQIGTNSIAFKFNSDKTTTVTDAAGIEQIYSYAATDVLTQVYSAALGKADKFYYENPQHPSLPSKIENKKGIVTTFSYDVRGNILQINIGGGFKVHNFEYDNLNNLTKYTDPLAKITTYGYDANGNLSSITDPRGTISFTRNSYGKIESITNALGHRTNMNYDNYGNTSSVVDPMMHSTNYTYDNISRLISMQNAKNQNTGYTYDANDLLTKVTDANSNYTRYDFDKNDNLISTLNALGKTTSLRYDYTNEDRLLSESNPSMPSTTYSYRNNGQLQSKTNPNGVSTNYNYDSEGRLIQISSSDINANFTLDVHGNIIGVSESGGGKNFGLSSFLYDELDRLNVSTDFYGNTVQYSYYKNDNIKSITYPGSKTVNYTYYDDNRISTVTDWKGNTTRYTYRSDGSIDQTTYPNGIVTSYTYDNAERVTEIKTIGNTTIADYKFTLDELGNHTQESITQPLSANPLLKSGNTIYSYDDANRLQSAGNIVYGWDNNGNMISKNENGVITQYSYDSENHLTAINNTEFNYIYDIFGNRKAAIHNGKTTRYVLDINGPMSQVLMETDENNKPLKYYIYGLGLIESIKADESVRYFHGDFRGSVVAITDQSGNIKNKYAYDAFGAVINKVEEDSNPFRYVGIYGVMDEGNGLQFMRARYYDPSVGRFISGDPIKGLNLYIYANNNTINVADPQGLWGMKSDKIISLIEIGGNINDIAEKYSQYQKFVAENDGINFVSSLNAQKWSRISSVVKVLGYIDKPLKIAKTAKFVGRAAMFSIDIFTSGIAGLEYGVDLQPKENVWDILEDAPYGVGDFIKMEREGYQSAKYLYKALRRR